MKFPAWLVILALLIGVGVGVILTPSCFSADESAQGSALPGKLSHKGESELFFVNGEAVYGSDLIASPIMRKGLLEYVQYVTLRQIVEEEGYQVDMDEVEDALISEKDFALSKGESWESVLRGRQLTEEERREQLMWTMTFEVITEDRANITDEMMEEYWTGNKDKIVRRYLTRNSIPQNEAESAKVTLDLARDIIYEDLFSSLKLALYMEFQWEVLVNTELDLACIKDKEYKALLEDLVVNIAKENAAQLLEEKALGEGELPGSGPGVGSMQGM